MFQEGENPARAGIGLADTCTNALRRRWDGDGDGRRALAAKSTATGCEMWGSLWLVEIASFDFVFAAHASLGISWKGEGGFTGFVSSCFVSPSRR